MPRVGKARDVADFGEHQQRGAAADAADVAGHVDVESWRARSISALVASISRVKSAISESKLSSRRRGLRAARPRRGTRAGRLEQVAVGPLDAVLGQDRADAVLSADRMRVSATRWRSTSRKSLIRTSPTRQVKQQASERTRPGAVPGLVETGLVGFLGHDCVCDRLSSCAA
jgi:hypothetical protein